MNQYHFIGKKVSSFERFNDIGPITGISLAVDDDNEYRSGTDEGFVLDVDCPYGTQEMADNLLANLQGKTYTGFRATGAPLPPEAELGDGVNVNGVYSMLAYRELTFGPGHMSEISAPGDNELEHEYPYESPENREFNRKIATLSSQIIKTSEEITLKIESTDNRITSLSTKIEGIELVVTSTDNRVTSLSAKLDSIKLSVTNGTTSSTIKLMAGSTEISSQEIKFDGIVTFDDLSTEGKTTIHGGNIQTETLRVQALYGSTVYLKTEEDRIAGIMSITGASTSDYAVEMDSYGALRFQAQTGAVYIASYTDKVYSSYIQLGKFDVSVGPTGIDFRPGADNVITLGTAEYYWNTIYCRNSNIDLSDRNAKENINYDMSRYDALFDLIRPCSYKFLDGDRTHWGVISQDFEQSLEACGFTSMDIAAFCKDKLSDGTERYAMRYTEMIPLLIWEVQSLKLELKRLKGEVQ